MVRYAQRPWYNPLGCMASSPPAYVFLVFFTGLTLVWPIRYRISEYFERQRAGPHVELRQKAVMYYNEIEKMHRRQALVNQENLQNDNSGHRQQALMVAESLRMGHIDQEYNYWFAHQRDAIRAEKLLLEIKELKAKLAL
ncbi:unnamed protein product [Phytomonas sp. Hart1]|nr:unnamed protein product [Phytomonas sp. Hart1]|eukprot:CCW70319.1 unnamed protein product [Phytomonas sp. isolate Hart1]